jgi:F-type H+-transporting ATPase subunit gamma
MAGGQERILRGRIRSVQATKKITRAMELIAASRIVKAQQRVAAAVPYSEQITEVVKDLAAAGGSSQSPLLAGRDVVKTTAYIAITADRGLCGGYNAGVQRATEGEIKDVVERAATTRWWPSAARPRGTSASAATGSRAPSPGSPTTRPTRTRRRSASTSWTSTSVARSTGSSWSTPASSPPARKRSCAPAGAARPCDVAAGGDGKAPDASGTPADFEFEPDPGTILDTLLPRYVEARIYAALLNAAASEHAFRQRAMKSATDNAEELIKNLSRIMNRARQDSITTEIMEIVSGAEALGGDAKKVRFVELGPLTDNGFDGHLDIRPASALAATAVGVLEPDDIEEIVGIGPVIGAHLREQGITTFAQIAAWTPEDADPHR